MRGGNKGRFAPTEERVYEHGEIIFREGDRTRELFVVQEGQVVVEKGKDESVIQLGVLTRGHIFGEMALLESLPRSATARARGKTRLLVVAPGGFLMKIRRDPTFAFELMQQLSHRIRATNERLTLAIDSRRATRVARELLEKDGYETLTADDEPAS